MAKARKHSPGDEGSLERPGAEELEGQESLKEALEAEKEKAEKYLANWQRAEADFINYKKRNEQERAEMASFANATLIADLLPVLDDFERALDNVPDDSDDPAWVDGVRLIYRKLRAVLEDRGLSRIEAVGSEFDPNFHEAVMCVEGEEGKVCEEIKKGYMLRERLLRPSMVTVGKEAESPESVEDDE